MRRSTGRAVLGAVLVLVGTAWLLESAGIVDISTHMLMAIALVVVGGALVATSSRGTSTGLVIAGIVLTALLLVDGPGNRQVLRRTDMERLPDRSEDVRRYAPRRGSQIRPYRQSSGQLVIDLSGTNLSGTENVSGRIDAGTIRVTVPKGVPIKVDARTEVGEIWIFGERRASGASSKVDFESPDYDDDRPRVTMDLRANAGEIRVEAE